jgi:O-antigen/teichoic acid export membrane protein
MSETTGTAAPQTGMRAALRKLASESAVYGLGQVSGRAVQVLLVPILTRALLPGAYAISDLVAAYLQTAVLVLVFGMDGALARFFYEEPDREARIRMVSSSFVFRVALTTIVSLALIALSGPLAGQLLGGEVYRKYLIIGAVTIPFTLLVLFANDVLRVTFQPWKFIVLNVAQTTIVAGISLYLVLVKNLGVVGVLYGRLGGDLACGLLGLVLIRHNLRRRFSRTTLARMLRYGAPLVPAAFAYGAIASLDRWTLQKFRPLDEVAIYAVAIKFFSLVSMGIAAFQLAYGPFAFARARSEQAPRLYARVFAAFTGVTILGAMAAGLFAPTIVAILAPRAYASAALPAALLAFAAVAQGAYTVASVGVALALRTPLLGLSAGGAALVAAAANLLLTPRFGPLGAAAATTAGYVASATLTYAIAQRVHPLPYRGGRLMLLGLLALGGTVAVQQGAAGGIAGVVLKLAAVLGMAVLMTVIGIWQDRGAVARSH